MAQQLSFEGGGQLKWTHEGVMVRLIASRPDDSTGLYKIWLQGEGGTYLLGTLMPEDGQLTLTRTVSCERLKQAGCWPISAVSCVMHFPFTSTENSRFHSEWHWDHRPSLRFSDPVLKDAAADWGSMLVRDDQDGFQLAVPADVHRPFPLLPLFCMAAVHPIDGQLHVMFSFYPSGQPRYPESPRST